MAFGGGQVMKVFMGDIKVYFKGYRLEAMYYTLSAPARGCRDWVEYYGVRGVAA